MKRENKIESTVNDLDMIVISDFGNILITLGLEAIAILLKMWLFFMIVLTTSDIKEVFVFSRR